MLDFIEQNPEFIQTILDVVLLIAPIVIAWYVRTYVKGTAAEKDIAAIVRLSNAAIDYVENLDKRGDLKLPPEVSRGGAKLKIAGDWLETELKRAGISMNDQEAQTWISSEFQRRVGGIQMSSTLKELAGAAVDLIQDLEKRGHLILPPGLERITFLSELAADQLLSQFAIEGAELPREKAVSWARAELLQRLKSEEVPQPSKILLSELTYQAIQFVQDLKAKGPLTIQTGGTGANVEKDIATAWLLTEVAKHGMALTAKQLDETMSTAFKQLT